MRAVKLYQRIYKIEPGKILGRQVLRSISSVGANIQESNGAQSDADYMHKTRIAFKENLESQYWLKVIRKSDIEKGEDIEFLEDETTQIGKILASIIRTKKANMEAKVNR